MYQPQPQPPKVEQASSNFNPYSGQYTQYNTSIPNAASLPYFPPFPHTHLQQTKSSPAPDAPPPPPDLSSITPGVASAAIRRLVTAELRDVGFDAAQADAIRRLEVEVVSFVEQLFHRAHEYANLANRAGAVASDLVLACDEFGLPPSVLNPARSRKRRRTETHSRIAESQLIPPPSRSPSPEMLPSDEEGAPPVIPNTLRGLPSYFPQLPPKHTYLRTPASPPKKAALPSLEKKLKTAGLVQESLRNLMLATEDSTGQEDAELLGHIVNWETGVHPRKRWKIGP